MNLQEFVDRYKDVPVDFDKAYGAQCVDLARQYMKDVWKFTQQPEPVVGAVDFIFLHNGRSVQKKLCWCVPYTGTVQPPVGSLVIFKPSGTNRFGHIAICLETGNEKIVVFEQDGIANEKALKKGALQKGAHIGYWSYDRLLGWLVKKEEK